MEVFLASVVGWIESMAVSNPKLVGILAIAYIVGLVMKILCESVKKFILESPSKADDAKLEAFEKSQVAKIVYFVIDLLIRFKK